MPERQRLLKLLDEARARPDLELVALRDALATEHPANAAYLFGQMQSEEAVALYAQLPTEQSAGVLAELDEEQQRELVRALPVGRLTQVLDQLEPDDAADVCALLPESLSAAILENLDKDLAAQIRLLQRYDEETAGAIMTPRFAAVGVGATIEEAREAVRATEGLETDQVYVVNANGRLRGVVSVQELLQEERLDRPVVEVMDDQIAAVGVGDDQEEALRHANTYGLATVPVVNFAGKLVGIITADDLDEVAEEEASEDIFRMAGTSATHPTKLSVVRRVVNRMPILTVTVVTGLVISQILGLIPAIHARSGAPGDGEGGGSGLWISALRFLPIVIAIASNAGTIANAIVVRGLATSELEHGRLAGHFLGEFTVGVGVGLLSAGLTLLGVGFLENWYPLGTCVAIALFISVVFSAAAGFAIPVASDKIGMDPAVTGPLVTALNDLSGTMVYVSMCLLLLS